MSGLSCSCEWEPEPGDICWWGPNDYTELPIGRRKRCCSCSTPISTGNICIRFNRYKVPEYDVEIAIYGEDGEVPRAPWWMCEECADLYWSLTELGFCFDISTSMRELVSDYAGEYGPRPLT